MIPLQMKAFLRQLSHKAIGALLFVAVLLAPANRVLASQNLQNGCAEGIRWGELRNPSFAIIYPLDNASLAQNIQAEYGDFLEEEYRRFASVFGVELSLPVTIRIYPTVGEYYCLNALAPGISLSTVHSHIGSREIALIGETILDDTLLWEVSASNAFRNELMVLFVEKLTGRNAPPGLLVGAGGYAENPNETFEARYQSSGLGDEPTLTWQYIWENPDTLSDAGFVLQSTTAVAYLIDVYGWEKFLELLDNFSTAQGYRQALTNTYGVALQDLQKQWRIYFPVYVQGRWRANVFHAFDLDVFGDLILAGAYIDAARGLQEAIVLIEAFGDYQKLEQAEALLQIAQTGTEAGALVAQSRQALQEGNYELSLALAEQAQTKYGQIGDSRRLEEIIIYQEWAREVIRLRGEVNALGEKNGLLSPSAPKQLLEAGMRLGELGDSEGVVLVGKAMVEVSTQQKVFVLGFGIVGLLFCLFLLLRQVRALREPRPPEVQLR